MNPKLTVALRPRGVSGRPCASVLAATAARMSSSATSATSAQMAKRPWRRRGAGFGGAAANFFGAGLRAGLELGDGERGEGERGEGEAEFRDARLTAAVRAIVGCVDCASDAFTAAHPATTVTKMHLAGLKFEVENAAC